MARAVFYSFHFDRDFWRVQQIRNIGAIEEQEILPAQRWEQVKREGETAVKTWINREMRGKSAVVVLVGAETAARPWVKYEVRKAWDEGIPLVGVRIHGLLNRDQRTDHSGINPFSQITSGGLPLSTWGVTLHDPAGINSQQRYASIRDNLPSWVDAAYKNL